MNADTLKGRLSVAMLVGLMAWVSPVHAQTPTAEAVAAAREYIVLKIGAAPYDSVVPGVIEHVKTVLLQTNPSFAKDLNEVALQLRVDNAPKSAELLDDIAKMYATRFTEQELKDLLAFYRTPLGKKVVAEEYGVVNQSMTFAQSWANKLSDQILSEMRAEMKKRGHDL
jgi:uncharacterized protein